MPALFAAVLVGILLTATGVTIALEESKVIDARLFLREAVHTTPSLDAMDRAYEVLSSGRNWRTDLAVTRFDLDVLALEATPQSEADAVRLARARQSAGALLALSPLSGRAWCRMATFMVRERGFSEQAARALQMCYDVAPREIAVVERRLFLSLSPTGRS